MGFRANWSGFPAAGEPTPHHQDKLNRIDSLRPRKFGLWMTPLLALSVTAISMVLIVACGADGPSGLAEGQKQIRGMMTEMEARSITEVELLRLEGDDGREYTFTTEGFVGFTPSHLREHQLFGQSLLITYVEKDGRLIAVQIDD